MSAETKRFIPYPGPRPFKKEERDRFFGRETEVRELLSLVTAHRTLLLYAQSGAGKSSLLNAGLIPLLLEEEFTTLQSGSLGGLIPPAMSLSEIPNVFVFSTLVCWADGKVNPTLLLKMSLPEFLKKYGDVIGQTSTSSPRVIIFDQFEELFTFYPERWGDREGFFKQIDEALEDDPLARVVFAMREDYIAQMDPYRDFLPEALRPRFRLERLDEEAALLAIKEPLRGTAYAFADGVAETLVKDLLKIRIEGDVGGKVEVTEVLGEFIEPVQLQVVCQSIWQRLPPQATQITTEHLRSVGDVDKVLSEFYDDAMQAAAEISHDEHQLRTWCDQYLITPTGTRGTVYRGPETTGGILNQSVDVLESKHLIRAERRAGGRWYELTHDRFIGPIQASNKQYFLKTQSAFQDAYDAMLQGDQARARSDFNRALEIYTRGLSVYQSLRNERGEAAALYGTGLAYSGLRNAGEAIRYFEAAVEIYLRMREQRLAVNILVLIANQYFGEENFDDAVKAATRAIELVPTEATAFDRRAAAYWYWGHLSEAIEDYTRELELTPDSTAALNGRGHCLAEIGRYNEAATDLMRLIELLGESGDSVSSAYAYNGLALAFAGIGQYENALRAFETSLTNAPNNGWAYFNRAQTYEWMKDPVKARENYKLALEKHDPPLSPLKRERAENYLKQSDVANESLTNRL